MLLQPIGKAQSQLIGIGQFGAAEQRVADAGVLPAVDAKGLQFGQPSGVQPQRLARAVARLPRQAFGRVGPRQVAPEPGLCGAGGDFAPQRANRCGTR